MRRTQGTYKARWSLAASHTILLALAVSRTGALSQQYCASFNTGSGEQKPSSDFMSNGECHDQCSGYAFAIVQYKNCWCSNTAPGGAGDASSCNIACPGFPSERCGNRDEGLFGYIALGPEPQGTQGGSSPSPSPSQAEDTSTPQPSTSQDRSPTVQGTVIETPSGKTSVVSLTSSVSRQTSVSTTPRSVSVPMSSDSSTTSSTPATTSSTSKTSSKSTWKPTPIVTVETVTGVAKTKTVTPTAPPQETQTIVAAADTSKPTGFFASPGKVAGTFVAVAIVFILTVAGLVLLYWRRKRNGDQRALPSTVGSVGGGTPQRRPSRMSQMGLLGSTRERNNLPEIQTSGWGPGNGTDKSPADTLDKRSSYPRMVDQRLEPTALWNPLHDNGSHVSIRSFKDDQDYSRRMLRVANPD